MRRIVSITVVSLLVALLPLRVNAAIEGLAVSPLRQQATVAAGKTSSGYFTVADSTEKPMKVTLSIKKFSVADYSYDYTFQTDSDGWATLRKPTLNLKAGQGEKAWYDIKVPEKATPGGYYYALVASTEEASKSGAPQTIQVVTILYLTVDGKLVRTSVLQDDSIPFLVTGSDIPYKFTVKDTGNVYFSAHFYGQLQSLFKTYPQVGTSHILMPGKPRIISGTIASPLLPGIYRVTYGYKVDFADFVNTKTVYIVYVPPWSIAALIFILLLARWLWQKRRKYIAKKKDA